MNDKQEVAIVGAVKGSLEPVLIVSFTIALWDALSESHAGALDGSSVLLIPSVFVIGLCAVALVEAAKAAVVTVRGGGAE